jgi:hypothetical protein
MDVAVTTGAGGSLKRSVDPSEAMNASRVCLDDAVVTIGAIGLLHKVRMRLELGAGMTVGARERAVSAGGEALWIHVIVTFEALFIRECRHG